MTFTTDSVNMQSNWCCLRESRICYHFTLNSKKNIREEKDKEAHTFFSLIHGKKNKPF